MNKELLKDANVMVCDSIMSKEKTLAMINTINNSPQDEKVFYIASNIEDVERIIDSCPTKNFVQPSAGYGKRKLGYLQDSFKNGNLPCIATTLSIFQTFDKDIIQLIKENNYTLYIDGTVQVAEEYSLLPSECDYDIFFHNYARIDENGVISLRDGVDCRGGVFDFEKKLCQFGTLFKYEDCDKKPIYVWLMPLDIFTAFKKTYILTYMFESKPQYAYYKYFGLPYKYVYIKGNSSTDYMFTENEEEQINIKNNYVDLISIYTNPKVDDVVCKSKNALSINWFKYSKEKLPKLKNSVYNFFRRGTENDNGRLWTTFNNYREKIQPKGNIKSFLSMDARTTDKHVTCDAVAYIANIYLNPVEKRFFERYGIAIDEDRYALSEMLQFIWLSAIQDAKPIDIYVPSKRMRELLEKWIQENRDSVRRKTIGIEVKDEDND